MCFLWQPHTAFKHIFHGLSGSLGFEGLFSLWQVPQEQVYFTTRQRVQLLDCSAVLPVQVIFASTSKTKPLLSEIKLGIFFLKLIFIVFVLKWCKWNKPTCLLLQSNELWFCLVISLTFSNVYEWINRNGISKKTLLLDETNKVKGMYQKLRGPKLNQILTQNMFDCMSCAQLTTDQILIIFRLMIKNF